MKRELKRIDERLDKIEGFKRSYPEVNFSKLELHYVQKRTDTANKIGKSKK